MASFPLKCIICSKSHDYSDISHLLTHIASKSHLSNYFQAQVRSHQDVGISQKLRVYDEWYSKNNMEKLLAQRMLQKEARKSSQGHSRATKLDRSREKIKRETEAIDHKSSIALDPSLSDRRPSSTSASGYSLGLPSTPKQSARQPLTDQTEKEYATPTSFQFSGPYPFVHQPRINNTIDPLPIYDGERISQRTASLDSELEQEFDEIERSDMTKLKGIIWPGMDLFDAASPEARRMRNQKKGSAVLATMQANSELVEPTEVIYHPSWEIKKERFISGEVESSPPPIEVPKRKRKLERPPNLRQPLMELDPNLFTNLQQNERFWTTSGGLHKNKSTKRSDNLTETTRFSGVRQRPESKNNETMSISTLTYDLQPPTKTEPIGYSSAFELPSPFLQASEASWRYSLPSPWAVGSELRYGADHLNDQTAEKENIPPGFTCQDSSVSYGSIAAHRQMFTQPAGKLVRPQLQHQVPPKVDLAALHAFHSSSISASLVSNSSGRQLAGPSTQETWNFERTLQRPSNSWVKQSKLPETVVGPAFNDEGAASSGDETIDQEADEGSFHLPA